MGLRQSLSVVTGLEASIQTGWYSAGVPAWALHLKTEPPAEDPTPLWGGGRWLL